VRYNDLRWERWTGDREVSQWLVPAQGTAWRHGAYRVVKRDNRTFTLRAHAGVLGSREICRDEIIARNPNHDITTIACILLEMREAH
jgi:hypothetical protein